MEERIANLLRELQLKDQKIKELSNSIIVKDMLIRKLTIQNAK